jgi:hypothetical protein
MGHALQALVGARGSKAYHSARRRSVSYTFLSLVPNPTEIMDAWPREPALPSKLYARNWRRRMAAYNEGRIDDETALRSTPRLAWIGHAREGRHITYGTNRTTGEPGWRASTCQRCFAGRSPGHRIINHSSRSGSCPGPSMR